MSKGLDPLVASILLIVIVVGVAAVIVAWQSGFLRNYTDELGSNSKFRLQCQRSGIEIVSAKFACGFTCAAGTAHELNITARNTGDYTLAPTQAFFKAPGGEIFTFSFAESVDAGTTKTITANRTDSCSAYVRTAEALRLLTECPDVSGSLSGAAVEWLGCP